jgi:hypothetical protein
MDLKQRKLDKSEWESIEVPVSLDEKEILSLIIKGYHDVNFKYNKINSLFTFLKIEYKESMEDYLFNKYFKELVEPFGIKVTAKANPVLKKADIIRIDKNDITKVNSENVFEILLIEIIDKMLKYKKSQNTAWLVHYFTLYKLIKTSVVYINKYIREIVDQLLSTFEPELKMYDVILNSVEFIEKNSTLLKNSDIQLYDHQKELFTILNKVSSTPKLILYIAPTGTGKTLSPIGLSEQYKVIFICAARHVGLALAKAAISIGKKIAFAFGCDCAADIRLHYFAAKEYTKDWKTGGIRKVDNSIGDKVEIMICDIKSYLPAMLYMQAFNPIENMVLYWDEPTISMDQEKSDLHPIIHENWENNIIPNVVLSSATLPKLHELTETVSSFHVKFPGSEINNICSHDCKKTIPIINKYGYVVLPHYLTDNEEEMLDIVRHCMNNLSLLRYLDLGEIVNFIKLVEDNNYIPKKYYIGRRFGSLDDVNMLSIKLHYLTLLANITKGTWGAVYTMSKINKIKRILPNSKPSPIQKSNSIGPGSSSGGGSIGAYEGKPIVKINSEQLVPSAAPPQEISGDCAIYVTTKDAYTLTDGPTLFLANDIEKIAKFCIQQANIPPKMMNDIIEKIEFNNKINERISILEHELEDILENSKNKESCCDTSKEAKKVSSSSKGGSTSKSGDNDSQKVGVFKINSELEMLRSKIKCAELNESFIPNRPLHLHKWASEKLIGKAFCCNIDEETIIKIMMLTDVADNWKILLLMGIGVFTNHTSITYTEIMKKMADEQRLYMIVASSDYIYGTNYQFCHGYLSKDLYLTQEKIIQALGRIGRSNIQQSYSVRFRDDEQIRKLFYEEIDKPEVRNMNILFK